MAAARVVSSDNMSQLQKQQIKLVEIFLNGAELSLNSVNLQYLINHLSMNWLNLKILCLKHVLLGL